MLKSTKGMLTVLIVLISVFMLLSPAVFAKWFVDIDDEGLKSLHVRADVYRGSGGDVYGQKHGRVQFVITEIEPRLYSYKFQVHLRKAMENTKFEIIAWANMPNIEFTLYGDLDNPNWWWLELIANSVTPPLDKDETMDGKIWTDLATLNLMGYHRVNTGMTFTTNERGSYKNIKSGIMTETDAMEYVLDLTWPIFLDYLGLGGVFPPEIDFEYFSIYRFDIHAGLYTVRGGLDFETVEKYPGGIPIDTYSTEEITVTYDTDGFIWEK